MAEVPTQPQESTKSVDAQLQDVRDQIAETPRPDRDAPVEEQRAYRKTMNEFSVKAAKLRKTQIETNNSLTDKEKDVLTRYDKGEQIFSIAQNVYEFANSQTVGAVMLIVRKAHADDWNEIEDINSTKGYTGIGVNA